MRINFYFIISFYTNDRRGNTRIERESIGGQSREFHRSKNRDVSRFIHQRSRSRSPTPAVILPPLKPIRSSPTNRATHAHATTANRATPNNGTDKMSIVTTMTVFCQDSRQRLLSS